MVVNQLNSFQGFRVKWICLHKYNGLKPIGQVVCIIYSDKLMLNVVFCRLSIIETLGTLNKKYNYTLSCSLKFVQHLKHFEHLVTVLGQATEVMVRNFNCSSMVMELVREISRIDSRELSRDTSGTRKTYNLKDVIKCGYNQTHIWVMITVHF